MSEPEPPSAEPIAGPIVIVGHGASNTAPFELEGGDYLVEVETSAGPADILCQAWLNLMEVDAQLSSVEALDSPGGGSSTTIAYRVAPGSYYWSALFGCQDWTVTMTPVDLPVEPARDEPIVRDGRGHSATTPFELQGGDYKVDWELRAGSSSTCAVTAVGLLLFLVLATGPLQRLAWSLTSRWFAASPSQPYQECPRPMQRQRAIGTIVCDDGAQSRTASAATRQGPLKTR
jgi:hypothetical protein